MSLTVGSPRSGLRNRSWTAPNPSARWSDCSLAIITSCVSYPLSAYLLTRKSRAGTIPIAGPSDDRLFQIRAGVQPLIARAEPQSAISRGMLSIGLGCLDNLDPNGASVVNAKLSRSREIVIRAQRSNLVGVAFARSGLLRRYAP